MYGRGSGGILLFPSVTTTTMTSPPSPASASPATVVFLFFLLLCIILLSCGLEQKGEDVRFSITGWEEKKE